MLAHVDKFLWGCPKTQQSRSSEQARNDKSEGVEM